MCVCYVFDFVDKLDVILISDNIAPLFFKILRLFLKPKGKGNSKCYCYMADTFPWVDVNPLDKYREEVAVLFETRIDFLGVHQKKLVLSGSCHLFAKTYRPNVP